VKLEADFGREPQRAVRAEMPLEPHGRAQVSVSEAEQERASSPGVSLRATGPGRSTLGTR